MFAVFLRQISKAFWRIGRFLPKKWKASSKERWVHTFSETWCSFAYGSSGALFVTASGTVTEVVSTNASHVLMRTVVLLEDSKLLNSCVLWGKTIIFIIVMG